MSPGQNHEPTRKRDRIKFFVPSLIISLAGIYTAAYLTTGVQPEAPGLVGMAVAAGILALIVASVLQAISEKKGRE